MLTQSKNRAKSITPRGTVLDRHPSLGGGIKNEVYEMTCQSCGDCFETTVPHAKICGKAECKTWLRKNNASRKNDRIKDARERLREARKTIVLSRDTILGLNWMGARKDDPRPAALKAIKKFLGDESDG